MKHTISIPDVAPEDIETHVARLREMTNSGVRSWSWVNGTLHIIVEEKRLSIRGKIIARIVYQDQKSWFAQYEYDYNRWMLVASRGDWLDKLEPPNPDEKTG
jgi:hypothetical protein